MLSKIPDKFHTWPDIKKIKFLLNLDVFYETDDGKTFNEKIDKTFGKDQNRDFPSFYNAQVKELYNQFRYIKLQNVDMMALSPKERIRLFKLFDYGRLPPQNKLAFLNIATSPNNTGWWDELKTKIMFVKLLTAPKISPNKFRAYLQPADLDSLKKLMYDKFSQDDFISYHFDNDQIKLLINEIMEPVVQNANADESFANSYAKYLAFLYSCEKIKYNTEILPYLDETNLLKDLTRLLIFSINTQIEAKADKDYPRYHDDQDIYQFTEIKSNEQFQNQIAESKTKGESQYQVTDLDNTKKNKNNDTPTTPVISSVLLKKQQFINLLRFSPIIPIYENLFNTNIFENENTEHSNSPHTYKIKLPDLISHFEKYFNDKEYISSEELVGWCNQFNKNVLSAIKFKEDDTLKTNDKKTNTPQILSALLTENLLKLDTNFVEDKNAKESYHKLFDDVKKNADFKSFLRFLPKQRINYLKRGAQKLKQILAPLNILKRKRHPYDFPEKPSNPSSANKGPKTKK